jgi:VWFA-related protein
MRASIVHLVALIALAASIVSAQGDVRFSARSELVILDVAVTDNRGGFVSGLPAEAFRVVEEGRLQKVAFFAEQDAPATIGLLIDASGSMLLSRDRMIAGITSLAEASNPDDEFLPLMFNERVMPVVASRSGFTSDPAELRDALTNNAIGFGKTAFHDALANAIDRVSAGAHERRVVVILSDGGDNASQLTFDELLKKVQASNLVIYTIALIDPVTLGYNRGALRRLAKETGGLAFEPRTIEAVGKSLHTIAADIRSRYTLAYEPTDTSSGSMKRVRVIVEAPKGQDLKVRTRTGYVTGTSPAPTGQ